MSMWMIHHRTGAIRGAEAVLPGRRDKGMLRSETALATQWRARGITNGHEPGLGRPQKPQTARYDQNAAYLLDDIGAF